MLVEEEQRVLRVALQVEMVGHPQQKQPMAQQIRAVEAAVLVFLELLAP
jgi:hypothetical protein